MNGRPLARRADLQNVHDVRVSGQPAHGALLTQETFEVVGVEIGVQHLDGDGAVEHRLCAAVDDAETAAADLLDLVETLACEVPRGCPATRSRCVASGSTSAIDVTPQPGGFTEISRQPGDRDVVPSLVCLNSHVRLSPWETPNVCFEGYQPSRGSTVRTRVTNTPKASMKSRRNCSVASSVTSPSSVIRLGVN